METQKNNSTDIVIDPHFRDMIPSLQPDECELLEQSILKEGCRNPLVVWQYNGKHILLDGHHRYEICQRHNLAFPVVTMSQDTLADRQAAEDWIDSNQLGRRNLNKRQFNMILGRRYNRLKQPHGGARQSSGQNGHLKTATKLAKENGVSEATVRRAGKFAKSVNTLKEVDPEVEKKIIEGKGPSYNKVVQAAEEVKNQKKKSQKGSKSQNAAIKACLSNGSDDWNTPAFIVKYVLKVMDTIDLDPCSNSKSAPNIPATHHFIKEDDGLKQDWKGRVFLNPPYGQGIKHWVGKLHESYEKKSVTEAIALLPSRTDTQWFHVLRCYPKCFITGRLKFSDAGNAAPFPSLVVYFGSDPTKFHQVFSKLGDIYTLMNISTSTPHS